MSWPAHVLGVLAPRPPEPPPGEKAPPGPAPMTWLLAVGVLGAVLGSLLSNFNTRLSVFAIADLRGGVGLGQDEGAWVTEAYNIAEIAIVPLTPWLASIISPRRAIASAVALQALAGVAVPSATSYPMLLTLRFLQGVGGGALIPLLLATVLRFLPLYQRIWGFAVYALVTTLTPMLSETVSGLLSEDFGWQAIFWFNLVPGPIVMFMVLLGLPMEPVKTEIFAKTDYFGMLCAVLTVSLLTVALDEGQRLDWFDSGLITGLFAGAAASLGVLLWHSLVTEAPLLEFRLLARANLSCGLLMIVAFTFATLGSFYVLPQFGTQVRGFRELQVGQILSVVAISQLVLCPLAAALLRVLDARLLLVAGLTLATVGSRLATYLTSDWIRGDFLGPLFLQASSLPFIMVPLLIVSTSALQPKDALAGGTLFNMVRTLAGTFGTAVIGAIVTVRERVHSNTILDHVVAGAPATVQAGGPARLMAEATGQAFTMAYADAYGWLGMITLGALIIVLFIRETRIAYPPQRPNNAPPRRDPVEAHA